MISIVFSIIWFIAVVLILRACISSQRASADIQSTSFVTTWHDPTANLDGPIE